MCARSENLTAGMVVAMTIAIAFALSMMSIHPPGGMDDMQQRTEARQRAITASWQSYRDSKCSLVRAEARPANATSNSSRSFSALTVRVWRCPHHQLFDEVAGAAPANWTTFNSQAG